MEKVLISQRKQWLDALRALAMLFVIFGHFYRGDPTISYFTNPVKVPLFFVISGYLLEQREDSLKTFFGKVLKGLVIPWLALTIVPELLFIPFKGISYFFASVVKIITGEKYWYMPCCILAEILFVLCKKLTKKTWLLSVVALCLMVGGYVVSYFGLMRIFTLNTVLTSQGFLLLGFILSKQEEKLQKLQLWVCLMSLAAYIAAVAIGVLCFPNAVMDVHEGKYYSAWLCALQILMGSFALFTVAPRIKWFPKWLTYIGRNTLVFYIFHTWGRMVLVVGLQLLGVTLPQTWYVSVAVTAVVCIGCGVLAALLNWLLPELVGKKRNKKVNV